jgi:hypothetical protein
MRGCEGWVLTNAPGSFLEDRPTVSSVRWEHSLTIIILFAHTEPLGWGLVKPELRRMEPVNCRFCVCRGSGNRRVHPTDLEAPGLKFVSPGIARK